MVDWLMAMISSLQRWAISSLATELRAGGITTAWLAFVLGALHALTPGHGKGALAAYFLGQDAKLATGLRVTLTASFLHVFMGALVFAALSLAVSRTPLMVSRGSPFFLATGYSLILFAGLVMLVQGLRPVVPAAVHPHAIALGIGLLPCPLTISVLGFAWAQGTGPMVVLVLIALAGGIMVTIGAVALLSIMFRRSLGRAVAHRLADFERWTRMLQAIAGAVIMLIAAYSLWKAL